MKKLINTTRVDDTTLTIKHTSGVPITLFATEEVLIENDAVKQALEFVDLQTTLDDVTVAQRAGRIEPFWDSVANADAGSLERIVLTPDFHKGGGIPVGTVADCRGFVIPQAVGNDICCGMRFVSTDVTVDELFSVIDKLPARLRHLFFLGGRDIPLSPKQREDILRHGLRGLAGSFVHNQDYGIWRGLKMEDILMDTSRTHREGTLPAKRLHNFGSRYRYQQRLQNHDSANARTEANR